MLKLMCLCVFSALSEGFRHGSRGFLSRSPILYARGSNNTTTETTRAKNVLQRRKSVGDMSVSELAGKLVFVRADLNVPMDENTQTIADDTRIRASVPTIQLLIGYGAKVVVASHMGRPKGKRNPKYSLAPIAERLEELLRRKVVFASECVGSSVTSALSGMRGGDVILLENLRYHKEEEENGKEFAKALSHNADVYVNDAFGAAHRRHSSTTGITEYIPIRVAGLLMDKELEFLEGTLHHPLTPFAAVVGGAKVSTKLNVLNSLIDKTQKIFLGGAMVFTFLKAMGLDVGTSIVENDFLQTAKDLISKASRQRVEFVLPIDFVVADRYHPDAATRVVDSTAIPPGWMGLDNGPKSTAIIRDGLADCKTILWNGPMGVSEYAAFAAGTEGVAKSMAELTKQGAQTIVGGGDSVAALERLGLATQMTHVSTGGGASLELLEGKTLPGVAVLDSKVGA